MRPKKHGNSGRKQSTEHIAKRVASIRKTKESWTKERYDLFIKRLSESHKGIKVSESQKKKMSKIMKGKKNSLGVKRSLEFKQNLSEYWKDNPNHNFRIDGLGEKRNGKRSKEMSRLEYRLWRENVFKRDSFTCVECGQIGGKLHADHIKPYSLFPELRFDIDNGRTLCRCCHKKTDTFAWKLVHKIRQHGCHKAYRSVLEEIDA